MTWEKLTEAEPQLVRIEEQAVWIAEHAGSGAFCANAVWYRFLKPQIMPLVGWSRGHIPECAEDGPRPMFIDWSMFWQRPGSVPATTHAEKMLRSEAAYDLAYQRIYELLPDCRHGDGMCWG